MEQKLYKQILPNQADDVNKCKRKLIRTRYTMIFFILASVALAIFMMVKNREYQHYMLSDMDHIIELGAQLNSVKEERDELAEKVARVSQYQPIFIYDIQVANLYEDGTIDTDYGKTIYSRNTMYLCPRIKYYGLKNSSVKFLVKLYQPNGVVSTGSSPESIPSGFSYASTENVYEGDNTVSLTSWGNSNRGQWSSGKYRYEIWLGDKCLKTKEFTIY